MDFRHCLFSYWSIDQVVTTFMRLIIKGLWFTFAHTEIGGGASFALMNKGIEIWRSSTSSRGTRVFELCFQSPKGFIELMQRGPRERETGYLQFTLQRPGDLICIPHLLAHALLTLDTGSPRFYPDGTLLLQQINNLHFNPWLSILSVCVVVCGAKFSVKKGLSALREWVFCPATGPQESKEKLEKHWHY